jgi:hypothetical protein
MMLRAAFHSIVSLPLRRPQRIILRTDRPPIVVRSADRRGYRPFGPLNVSRPLGHATG